MWRTYLFTLFYLLLSLLLGCTHPMIPGAPYDYDPERLMAIQSPPIPVVKVTVSLNDLKKEIAGRLATGDDTKGLSLGGLSKIDGYRWNSARQDIEIFGETGDSAREILLSEFVSVYRTVYAGVDTIWMSLDPEDVTDLTKNHAVHVFPESIVDTAFLVPLIQADYFTKVISQDLTDTPYLDNPVSLSSQKILNCEVPEDQVDANLQNLFFTIDLGDIELDYLKLKSGYEYQFLKTPIVLMTGQLNAPDHIVQFARSFTQHYAEVEADFPAIFGRLHNAHDLFLLAVLLVGDELEDRIPIDSHYWISEYPLTKNPTPRTLPGMPLKTVARYCEGPRFNYINGQLVFKFSGGVVFDLHNVRTTIAASNDHQQVVKQQRPNTLYFNNTDILHLQPDGRFLIRQGTTRKTGHFKIQVNQDLLLTFDDGGQTRGRAFEGTFVDPELGIWTPLVLPETSSPSHKLDRLFNPNYVANQLPALHKVVLGQQRNWLPAPTQRLLAVRKLLEQGAEINQQSSTGATALHFAALRGDDALLALLKQFGASWQIRDQLGLTAADYAVISGRVDLTQQLKVRNESTPTKLTPMHLAAALGKIDMVQALIFQGFEIDSRDARGNTPLAWAAAAGHLEIVKILLSFGASIDGSNNVTLTHEWTTFHSNQDIFMLASADPNTKDKFGISPLIRAIEYGRDAVASLLVERGANINMSEDTIGLGPLHLAAAKNRHVIVEMLLRNNVDILIQDHNHWTPLHYAAANGHSNIAVTLLDHDAQINAIDNEGITPLHLAAYYGWPQMAKLLLNRGADSTIREYSTESPGNLTATEVADWRKNLNVKLIIMQF